MKRDVIDTIEAAYRLELPPAQWLSGVGDSFYAQLGTGTGLYGCEYRLSNNTMKVGEELRLAMPDPSVMPVRETMEMMPIEFLRKTFARCDCATQSQHIEPELRPFIASVMAPLAAYGWYDIMAFSGIDPAGHGVYFGAWLPRRARLSPALRARWMRVATHVATALRLRRRIAGEASAVDAADAVLTPDGKVDHAVGDAQLEQARLMLRSAVLDVERARGKLRRYDPDQAVDSWKGLVASRWSLVDHFETGGKRYVLARRNDLELTGLAALSERERQALGYAELGHSNKLIAYELGVAPSTVAVLLHRAARKLGTHSRGELLETYRRLTKPSG